MTAEKAPDGLDLEGLLAELPGREANDDVEPLPAPLLALRSRCAPVRPRRPTAKQFTGSRAGLSARHGLVTTTN